MASVGSASVGFACPMFPGQVLALGENSKKLLSLGKRLRTSKFPWSRSWTTIDRYGTPILSTKVQTIMSDFIETNTNDDGIVEIGNSGSQKGENYESLC